MLLLLIFGSNEVIRIAALNLSVSVELLDLRLLRLLVLLDGEFALLLHLHLIQLQVGLIPHDLILGCLTESLLLSLRVLPISKVLLLKHLVALIHTHGEGHIVRLFGLLQGVEELLLGRVLLSLLLGGKVENLVFLEHLV